MGDKLIKVIVLIPGQLVHGWFIAETIKRRIAEKKSMMTEEKSKETNHMAEVAALFGKSLKEEFTVR